MNNIQVSDNFIAIIDSKLCENKDACLQTIAAALQFPEYFNDNLDSLDECLQDLEWIKEKKIICLFINHESFLKNDAHLIDPIMSMFNEAKDSLKEYDVVFSIITVQ
jgi:RNAse (barnase) inhibitor barstar